MAANSWALACLWLALGQNPSEPLITNQRSFTIPVNIQESRRAELRELVLYASNDLGRTWQQVASILPTQSAFTFNAPIDGMYWLRSAVVNRLGKQEPDNLYQGPPDQKVVIDSMKPMLRLKTPERVGEEVSLAWELQEDHPDWPSFRLEYQPKDGGPAWTPIHATAGLTGQVRFRPNTPGAIAVRLSLKDQAGNQAYAAAEVAGTVSTTAFTNPQAAVAPAPGPLSPSAPQPLPQIPSTPEAAPSLPPPVGSMKLPPPPVDAPKTFPSTPPPVAASWSASGAKSTDPGKVVATSQAITQVAQSVPVVEPRRPLPPLKYVNHPDVTFEYTLSRVGPSGIGSVDLWMTQNDGQTWEHLAEDPESRKGTMTNGTYKRTLDLPGDGVYGFVLAVKSKAGLGKGAPRPGDLPDFRVEVDTTAPVTHLYQPQPDSTKPNTLLLRWSAADNNLANTIVLEYAAKREGPWLPIAAPPANAGKYSWPLPDRLPVQVYLRLRAGDLAGNESIALTSEPQVVDLSEPEGRVVDVSVSPRQ